MGSGASVMKDTTAYRVRGGHASSGTESYRVVELFPSLGSAADTFAVCMERPPSANAVPQKSAAAGKKGGATSSRARRILAQQQCDVANRKAAVDLERRLLSRKQLPRKPVSETTAVFRKWQRSADGATGGQSVRAAAAILLRHMRLIATTFGGARVYVCRRDRLQVISPVHDRKVVTLKRHKIDLAAAAGANRGEQAGYDEDDLSSSYDSDDSEQSVSAKKYQGGAANDRRENDGDDDGGDADQDDEEEGDVDQGLPETTVVEIDTHTQFILLASATFARLVSPQLILDHLYEIHTQGTGVTDAQSVGVQEMAESLLGLAKHRANSSQDKRSLSVAMLAFEYSADSMGKAGGGALPHRSGDVLGHADLSLVHSAAAVDNGQPDDPGHAGQGRAVLHRKPVASAARRQLARLERVTEMRREVVLDEPFMMCALAASGDTVGVDSLLKGGVSPGAADYDGRTALHVAATHGQTTVVQMLLAAGAPINPVDNFGRTPLHQALEAMQHATADLLRSHGGVLSKRVRQTAGAKAVVAEQRLVRYRTWFNSLHPTAKEIGRLPTESLLRWLWKHTGLRPAKLQHQAARAEKPCSRPLAVVLQGLVEADNSWGGGSDKGPGGRRLKTAPLSTSNDNSFASTTVPWSRFASMMVADLADEPDSSKGIAAGPGQARPGALVSEFNGFNPLKLAVQKSLALPRWRAVASTIAEIFHDVKEIPLSKLYGNVAKLLSVTEGGGLAGDEQPGGEDKLDPSARMTTAPSASTAAAAAAAAEYVASDKRPVPTVSKRIGTLAEADPEEFSLALVSVDGQVLELGDWTTEFPMLELISPILYAFAYDELGSDFVHEFVGHSSAGVNTEYALDAHKRPLHALTTGGAMVISTLIDAHLPLSQRFGRMMTRMFDLAGGLRMSFSQATYLAEQGSSYGTFALAHFIHEALPTPLVAARASFAAEQRRLAEEEDDDSGSLDDPDSDLSDGFLEGLSGFAESLGPRDSRIGTGEDGEPSGLGDTLSPVATGAGRGRRLGHSQESGGGHLTARRRGGTATPTSLNKTLGQRATKTPRSIRPNSSTPASQPTKTLGQRIPKTPRMDASKSSHPPSTGRRTSGDKKAADSKLPAGVVGAGGEAAAAARIKDLVDFFFQMSAIEVNTATVAALAATLAAGGRSPLSGKSVLGQQASKACLQLMYSAGVQLAGEWSNTVGLPAKSAETGTIMMVLPNKLGLCVRAPALDANGLSARGLEFCRRLTQAMPDWTLMSGNTGMANAPGGEAANRHGQSAMDTCPHCFRSLTTESAGNSVNASRRSSGDWSDFDSSDF